MEREFDSISILECRHRKEKKELQAKIQALKKAAKNDKTKKKELAAEIIELESELETKHQQELNAYDSHSESHADANQSEEIISETADNAIPKLSKAQKRRDKKLQQDKEREEQIKLQEKENMHGPRQKEIQAISARLKEKRLKIFPISSDGDCLYKAVSHQLSLKRDLQLAVGNLRAKVSSYIRENKDDFIPFMSNPETCDMLTDAEFESYCDKIRDTKVWGGQLEIRALSNLLKCPIAVIQATGPETIDQGSEFEGPALLITYHRHMYQLGEHYNSTSPNDDEN
ncbi:OTU domain-containing protein 6B [Operophtera brumata]|uniref:OTU domain-containing protein 6B n=1 Tax=Operophtera brumata TaxID=104452 RepID=A0A0L7LC18_OPEBR|nr:OTU domain-containing protein 6B [Operophtera brumata]